MDDHTRRREQTEPIRDGGETASPGAEAALVDDLLEDVSIDGMCGVY